MKASELMIGDWVTGKKWREKSFKLSRINDNGKYYYGITSDGTQVGPFLLEEIEPIPLTPEILEKNGFVYDSEDKLFEDIYPRISMLYAQYRLVENSGINYGEMSEIKYVHELQHALRICGIDKEIKL